MKLRSNLSLFSVAFLLLLVRADALHAAQPTARFLDNNPSELSLLQQAYGTLAHADHDYKGHRVKAMRSIEAACDLLGSDIRGDGKGREKQPVSDAQLREAQSFVEQANQMAAQQHQQKVGQHLSKAISEISLALSVK